MGRFFIPLFLVILATPGSFLHGVCNRAKLFDAAKQCDLRCAEVIAKVIQLERADNPDKMKTACQELSQAIDDAAHVKASIPQKKEYSFAQGILVGMLVVIVGSAIKNGKIPEITFPLFGP